MVMVCGNGNGNSNGLAWCRYEVDDFIVSPPSLDDGGFLRLRYGRTSHTDAATHDRSQDVGMTVEVCVGGSTCGGMYMWVCVCTGGWVDVYVYVCVWIVSSAFPGIFLAF